MIFPRAYGPVFQADDGIFEASKPAESPRGPLKKPALAFSDVKRTHFSDRLLAQLIEILQYGTSVKADATIENGRVPVLRMGNIQEGIFDFSDLKYIDPQKEDIAKYALNRGDILINRTNSAELVGKCALFNREGVFVFASYLIKLKAIQKIANSVYLVFCINSEIGRRHIDRVKHQVVGQANINSKDIRSLAIPLPPLAEQTRIVAEVERQLSVVTAMEQAVEAGLARAARLRQSILREAFAGRL